MNCAFALPTPVQRHALCTRPAASVCARRSQPRMSGTDAEQAGDTIEASAITAAAATLILKKAASAYTRRPGAGRRPSAPIVREAMLQLEKAQRTNRTKTQGTKLLGQWRLVCIADPKEGNNPLKTLYFPLRAQQTFYPTEEESEAVWAREEEGFPAMSDDAGAEQQDEAAAVMQYGVFDNAVFFAGPALHFRISGPCRWMPKMNRLEFSVDTLRVRVGSWRFRKDGLDPEGRSIGERTAKTLPFFTFFCVRDDIAVARGRSGGLALYTRVADDEQW